MTTPPQLSSRHNDSMFQVRPRLCNKTYRSVAEFPLSITSPHLAEGLALTTALLIFYNCSGAAIVLNISQEQACTPYR